MKRRWWLGQASSYCPHAQSSVDGHPVTLCLPLGWQSSLPESPSNKQSITIVILDCYWNRSETGSICWARWTESVLWTPESSHPCTAALGAVGVHLKASVVPSCTSGRDLCQWWEVGVVMWLKTTLVHRRIKPWFFELTETSLFLVSGEPWLNVFLPLRFGLKY